jgi:hypothetical protein
VINFAVLFSKIRWLGVSLILTKTTYKIGVKLAVPCFAFQLWRQWTRIRWRRQRGERTCSLQSTSTPTSAPGQQVATVGTEPRIWKRLRSPGINSKGINSASLFSLTYWPSRTRICKSLWSPGIDSEESISPAYVAWRASTTNRVSYRPARLRIDTWSP